MKLSLSVLATMALALHPMGCAPLEGIFSATVNEVSYKLYVCYSADSGKTHWSLTTAGSHYSTVRPIAVGSAAVLQDGGGQYQLAGNTLLLQDGDSDFEEFDLQYNEDTETHTLDISGLTDSAVTITRDSDYESSGSLLDGHECFIPYQSYVDTVGYPEDVTLLSTELLDGNEFTRHVTNLDGFWPNCYFTVDSCHVPLETDHANYENQFLTRSGYFVSSWVDTTMNAEDPCVTGTELGVWVSKDVWASTWSCSDGSGDASIAWKSRDPELQSCID